MNMHWIDVIKIGSYAGIIGKTLFNTNGIRRYLLEKRWKGRENPYCKNKGFNVLYFKYF